ALLVAMNRWLFGVPFKGSGVTLALGNYMGNKSDADDRRYNNRDNRRYYRDDNRGRGHAYGHRKKNKHRHH
ncbi:hypothetical protein GHN94_13595, partial [Pseudomonas helleri]|nr:hypothetical protein [Pseudomonas helleri]